MEKLFIIWLAVALLGVMFVATRKYESKHPVDRGLRNRQLIAAVIWPLTLVLLAFLLGSELFIWLVSTPSEGGDDGT